MELKLSNEYIAKVFAIYWGCKIIILDFQKEFTIDADTLSSFHHTNNKLKNKYKLLLTPLSAISDEHAIEVAKMAYRDNAAWVIKNGKNLVQFVIKDDSQLMSGLLTICIFQYLISKGYAVPLYFGIDHWANGKDAITLGIGIDKTKQ